MVTCELTGNDGNAFGVLGRVVKALKAAGRQDLVDAYRAAATGGDYDNLLRASMAVLDEAGIEWT